MNFNQATRDRNTIDQADEVELKKSNRVNITTLLSRNKKRQSKEKAETYIFVGLASALVIISGILISL